jgi:hypothetical protein
MVGKGFSGISAKGSFVRQKPESVPASLLNVLSYVRSARESPSVFNKGTFQSQCLRRTLAQQEPSE